MTKYPITNQSVRRNSSLGISSFGIPRQRRGVTLLEVLAASTVMAAALVPALRLMAGSLEQSREMEVREALATLAMSLLECDCGQTAGNWDLRSRTRTGLGRIAGVPQLVVQTRRSDAVVKGGIPDRLAVVEVVAWRDSNRNGMVDESEMAVRFSTKVGRFVSYGYEARNS